MYLTSPKNHPLRPELIHRRLKIGSWTTFYTIDTTIKRTLCESGSCPSNTPSAPEDLSEISIRSGGQSLNAYEQANMFSTRGTLEHGIPHQMLTAATFPPASKYAFLRIAIEVKDAS